MIAKIKGKSFSNVVITLHLHYITVGNTIVVKSDNRNIENWWINQKTDWKSQKTRWHNDQWHTSLKATLSLSKIKVFRHSAKAGVSQNPLQKVWDVSELFWMGNFGDNPQKLHFPIFWAPKTYYWGQKLYLPSGKFILGLSYFSHKSI